MEEKYLDWDQTRLFGFEVANSNLVEKYRLFLRRGDQFPGVYVGKIGSDLLIMPPDGGHHRALSHYLEREPLKVIILGDRELIPETQSICFSVIAAIRNSRTIFDIRKLELSLK